ncbi:hypothetical protein HmCmsJML017_02284 [Escherichia coli]|nr:hypothetical protein HmCmsJML017_02284 [Escherichia coli]
MSKRNDIIDGIFSKKKKDGIVYTTRLGGMVYVDLIE